MEAVPHTLPALWRAEKIVSRSVKAGFNWDFAAGALDKLDEETAELRQAVEAGQPVDSPHGIREELGDALFILCKIAQMSGVDPEDALHRACDKYQGPVPPGGGCRRPPAERLYGSGKNRSVGASQRKLRSSLRKRDKR